MRRRFTEEQIIKLLQEGEAGRRMKDLSREHAISQRTYVSGRPTTFFPPIF